MVGSGKDSSRTALWATDAFAEESIFFKALQTLKAIATAEFEIEPIHVLSPGQIGLSRAAFKSCLPRYEQATKTTLQSRFTATNLFGLQATLKEPKILISFEDSTRAIVARFLDYAREKQTNLIVTSTHARHGIERLLLGSFAETLLLQSEIPILTTNPDASPPARFDSILCCIDYNTPIETTLDQVAQLAATMNARLGIFHKLILPVALITPDAPAIADIAGYIRDEAQVARTLVNRWTNEARSRGVAATALLDDTPGTAADAIIETARALNYSMVAIVTQASSLGTSLLGSTARAVARASPVPVWIVRRALSTRKLESA